MKTCAVTVSRSKVCGLECLSQCKPDPTELRVSADRSVGGLRGLIWMTPVDRVSWDKVCDVRAIDYTTCVGRTANNVFTLCNSDSAVKVPVSHLYLNNNYCANRRDGPLWYHCPVDFYPHFHVNNTVNCLTCFHIKSRCFRPHTGFSSRGTINVY